MSNDCVAPGGRMVILSTGSLATTPPASSKATATAKIRKDRSLGIAL
jgi:hypothetical protein